MKASNSEQLEMTSRMAVKFFFAWLFKNRYSLRIATIVQIKKFANENSMEFIDFLFIK